MAAEDRTASMVRDEGQAHGLRAVVQRLRIPHECSHENEIPGRGEILATTSGKAEKEKEIRIVPTIDFPWFNHGLTID